MGGSVEDRGNGVDDALPLGGVHGLVGLLSLLGGTLLLEALRRDLLRTPTTLVLPRHVCLQSGRQAAAARPVSHTAKQRSSEGRILPPVCGNRHGVTRLFAGCIGADMGGLRVMGQSSDRVVRLDARGRCHRPHPQNQTRQVGRTMEPMTHLFARGLSRPDRYRTDRIPCAAGPYAVEGRAARSGSAETLGRRGAPGCPATLCVDSSPQQRRRRDRQRRTAGTVSSPRSSCHRVPFNQ